MHIDECVISIDHNSDKNQDYQRRFRFSQMAGMLLGKSEKRYLRNPTKSSTIEIKIT